MPAAPPEEHEAEEPQCLHAARHMAGDVAAEGRRPIMLQGRLKVVADQMADAPTGGSKPTINAEAK